MRGYAPFWIPIYEVPHSGNHPINQKGDIYENNGIHVRLARLRR